MLRGHAFLFGLALPFFLVSCSFTTIDPEAFDHVATAASFAQGEGSIASVVAATSTADSIDNISELRVVYVDKGDLWIWTQTGGAVELYDSVQPVYDVRLSDDGQVIVFLLEDGTGKYELWAMNWGDNGLRILLDSTSQASLFDNELTSLAVSRFLTSSANSSFSDLETDRERVVFEAIHPDGKGWDLWLQTPDDDMVLIASPTGDKIVFDFANP